VKHGIFQHVQAKRNLVSSSGHVMFYYDINKYQWNTKPFLFCCERCDLLSYHSSGDLFTWEDNMLFPLVKVCFRAKAHFVLCNNTIEFMFQNIFMPKKIIYLISITIMITLEGIEKITTEKNDNKTVWTITRAFTSWMAFIFPQWKYTIHNAKLAWNYKILPFEFSKIVENMKGKFDKAYL